MVTEHHSFTPLPVTVHDGVQSVGNGKYCAVGKLASDCLLDQVISFHVHSCCCLIQNQDFGLPEEGPGQAQKLPLPHAVETSNYRCCEANGCGRGASISPISASLEPSQAVTERDRYGLGQPRKCSACALPTQVSQNLSCPHIAFYTSGSLLLRSLHRTIPQAGRPQKTSGAPTPGHATHLHRSTGQMGPGSCASSPRREQDPAGEEVITDMLVICSSRSEEWHAKLFHMLFTTTL